MGENEKVGENHVARAARYGKAVRSDRSAADELSAALQRVFDEFVESDPPALPRFPHAFFAVNEFHAQVIAGMAHRWGIATKPVEKQRLRQSAIQAFINALEKLLSEN